MSGSITCRFSGIGEEITAAMGAYAEALPPYPTATRNRSAANQLTLALCGEVIRSFRREASLRGGASLFNPPPLGTSFLQGAISLFSPQRPGRGPISGRPEEN